MGKSSDLSNNPLPPTSGFDGKPEQLTNDNAAQTSHLLSRWQLIWIGVIVWFFLLFVAYVTHLIILSIITFFIITIGLLRYPNDYIPPDPYKIFLLVGPMFTLIIVGFAAILQTNIYPLVVAVIVAGLFGILVSRAKIREAIAHKMKSMASPQVESQSIKTEMQRSELSAAVSSTTDATELTSTETSNISSKSLPVMPLEIWLIKPEDLPETSAESRIRLEAIRARGPQVRKLYRRAVMFLATSSFLLAIAAWWMDLAPSAFHYSAGVLQIESAIFPWFSMSFFLITLLVLKEEQFGFFRKIGPYRALFYSLAGQKGADRLQWLHQVVPIRPVVLPALGGFWLFVTLGKIFIYSAAGSQWRWLPILIALAISSGYLAWIYWQRNVLQRRYPVYPPLNLLALRVFNSPGLRNFLDLIDHWQWLGTLQMLHGPDTTGMTNLDLVHYLRGRIEDSIVKTPEELQQALRKFSSDLDSQLRYPLNAMQCSEGVWRQALQHVLDRVDVVIMDLSDFSDKNRGSIFEIGKLFDQVPLTRVFFLVNEATDMVCLKEIFHQARHKMRADSPNRQMPAAMVRLLEIGQGEKRTANESIIDWERRVFPALDEGRLIGMLYDAALSAQTPARRKDLRRPKTVDWGRLYLPRPLRIVRNLVFVGFILGLLLTALCSRQTKASQMPPENASCELCSLKSGS